MTNIMCDVPLHSVPSYATTMLYTFLTAWGYNDAKTPDTHSWELNSYDHFFSSR